MVKQNRAHFPNESAAYRTARNELLAEEIEVRRRLERLAEQRRNLPLGGQVPTDFAMRSAEGVVRLSELFGDHDTLMMYSMMFGPQRPAPCPMCTSFLQAWDGIARNLRERVALAVTARSPLERLLGFQAERSLCELRFLSDETGEYTRSYVSADDGDVPGFSVFVRREGEVYHFYSGEMSGEMADPGQDPRSAPDLDPLWQMLDYTPEGRGVDWYPTLKKCEGCR